MRNLCLLFFLLKIWQLFWFGLYFLQWFSLIPFFHALIRGLFRRILYSSRSVTYFFWVLGTFWFCRTLHEPRKQQEPEWHLRIILFYFPHAKDRPIPERSGEATGQRGSCSHKEKSGEFQWLFRRRILEQKRGHSFFYVIFGLKWSLCQKHCVLNYRVAILSQTYSTSLIIVIHLLFCVRVFI